MKSERVRHHVDQATVGESKTSHFVWLRDGSARPCIRRALLCLAVLLSAPLALSACGRDPGGDALRVVPASVSAAVVAPSLGFVQARVSGFLAGIEGASGVLDLLADRYGFDLRTPEGPKALGLDVQGGAAVFVHDGAWVAVASVDDPDRFLEEARSRLERGAGAVLAAGQPSEVPAGGAWRFEAKTWHAALGVTADRVGILAIADPGADVVAKWNAIASNRERFDASPKAASAKAALGPDAVAYVVTDGLLPDAPKQLGLLRGFVQNILDALPVFTGGVAMPLGPSGAVESLVVKVSADHIGDGALPVQWVQPTGSPDRLAQAFPKTTTGFVRVRVALDNVRVMPGFIRDTVLPERLPGLEALPLPSVSDLIDLLEGDIAVGLLGLDPAANLGQLGTLRSDPRRALDVFHFALAARLRDATATKRAFASIASQLATSDWTVAAVVAKGYEGWSLAHGDQHYAILIDDAVAVFIIGRGEVDGFLAVKEGRALPLASYAEGGSANVARALGLPSAGSTPSAFGLALSPLRLLRELSARGLPPYFLKIINDVRLVTLDVAADKKRLDISLEVGL